MQGIQQQLPWEKPRVKRILELFGGRVYQVKKISAVREVHKNDEEIQR